MYEAKTHFDSESITPLPSGEVIADPSIAWHAIRGYDFAGLESIMQDGLFPAKNQQDFSVSVSVSPQQAWFSGREANSFYAYTLQDGISLAIKQENPVDPSGNHCDFDDEARLASVSPDAVTGVLLPEEALNRPLVDIATRHEARKPMQARKLIERTVSHIETLGGQIDEETQVVIEDCLATSKKGEYITREQSDILEELFMKAYSDAIEQTHGISNPTIKDALEIVLARAKSKPKVYIYSHAQKQEIGSQNARLYARNQARGIGRLGLSDSFIF